MPDPAWPAPRHLRLGRRVDDLPFQRDEIANAHLGHLQRLEHLGLADLQRSALHHVDRVGRAGHHEIDAGELELLEGGIQDPLPVHPAHPHRGERPVPRYVRGAERDRRSHGGKHVGVILLVSRQHRRKYLDLVLEALRKERPDAAIDQPAGEDLLVGRAPLPLEKPSRNLPRGIGLLAVLDREGKERQRADVGRHGDGGEHHRVAELHERRSGGLLGEAAGLDHEAASGELGFDPMYGHDGFVLRAHQCSEGAPMCSFGTPSGTLFR